MIGSRSFPKGGLHPRDQKSLTRERPLWNAIVPSTATVPLQQHIGAPAQSLVKPGERVREGQLIGKAQGRISANVHAPIPGTVRELKTIYLPSGVKTEAIVIDLEGEFERLGKPRSARNWSNIPIDELRGYVQKMGIVGMGGATFPTHVKFQLPPGASLDCLILNGAECEPYLSADHRLMVEHAAEVVEGARIIERLLSPGEVIIGIEENKRDAIDAVRKAVRGAGVPFRVLPLKVKYPQGDEKNLIKSALGREVPSGALPLDVGVVVSNIGTVFAVYEAVAFEKPVIERVVTVSGGAVRNPANLKVRIGTSIAELIEECGGLKEIPVKIVAGGPMTGFTVYDVDTPVTKSTSGVLALTSREVAARPQTACINCGRCVRSCPIGLQPTRLFKHIDHLDYDAALADGLMDCRECGICGYVCPAGIPLVQGLRVGKRIARVRKARSA